MDYKTTRRQLRWQGARIGFLMACVGSVVISTIDFTSIFIKSILIKSPPTSIGIIIAVIGFTAFVALLLSCLPAVWGGAQLAKMLDRQAREGHCSIRAATVHGLLLGAFLGFGISCFVGAIHALYFINEGHGSMVGVYYFTIFAVITASTAGGLTGRILAKSISKNTGYGLRITDDQ